MLLIPCDVPLSNLNVLREKCRSFLGGRGMKLKCNLHSLESSLIFFARPDRMITKASRITMLAFSKRIEETLQLEKISPKVDLNYICITRTSKLVATQFDFVFHRAYKEMQYPHMN